MARFDIIHIIKYPSLSIHHILLQRQHIFYTYNLVFRPLQIVADSTSLLIVAVLMEALSMYVMTSRLEKVGADPPDIWFGCQEDKLFNYLEEIGPIGRLAYVNVNNWDFFPYMPSYMM